MVCYLTSVSTAKITLPVLLKNLSSVQGLSSLKYVYNKTGLLSTTQTIKLKKNTQNQSQPQLIQPTFTLHGHLIQQIYYYYYYCCCLVCSSFAFSYVSCLMSFVICQYVVLVLLLVTWLWTQHINKQRLKHTELLPLLLLLLLLLLLQLLMSLLLFFSTLVNNLLSTDSVYINLV